MSKHYDVVVLGAGIGALSAAALLARRSWRVLVLGQGYKPAEYAWSGFPLARRAFTFLAGPSPAWERIVVELAQSQAFRRHVRALDPKLQVFSPRRRFEVPTDPQLFARELDREFPEVRRVVDQLYAELSRTDQLVDAAFAADVVWPPGTFWERRETTRVAARLPRLRDDAKDLLADFAREHPYRAVVETPARFAGALGTELPPFAVARLHGAWTRGVLELARGEAELTEFLVDRVRAHGGEVKLRERASHVAVRRGRVSGVRIPGDLDMTGVQFVVTDLTSTELLELASDFRPSRRALDARPALSVEASRFVTSFVVRDEGIPSPLGVEAFLLPAAGPSIHLQKSPAPSPLAGTTLLVAETLVSTKTAVREDELRRLRAEVARAVQSFLPYVERHYLVVDSPHDGLPLWDYRSGKRVLVDRIELRAAGGSREGETMDPLFRVDEPFGGGRSLGGVAGEPIRFPIGGVFGVGRSVLPALGQEGELLAAWGAARTITRTDRRKEKMRREMWSKVELA